jgi:hypothetical protein
MSCRNDENNMSMDQQTLFIVGCARTGSTLLRQIMNKNERLCLASETHFLRRWSRFGRDKQIAEFGNLSIDANIVQLAEAFYSDQRTPTTGYWGWLKQTIDRAEFTRHLLATDRSDQAIFTMLLTIFAESKKGAYGSDLILGEKTPAHLYSVPQFFDWFPNAKVVHTFRDPRGIFVSTLKRMQTNRWGLKAKYPALPSKLVDPLIHPLTVLFTTRAWLDAVRLHAQYEQAYRGRYMLVRFEDLVTDPDRQVRAICDFIQVPFDHRMIDEVNVVSSSYREQRRGPGGFDSQNANRWQSHINPLTKTWFSFLGRKHLKHFGYNP